ncbi:MAG: phosphate ABC transporter permease PstA [Candidatus Competibacteraceae bacterium]|nr:phosphate ABC transporter permease PstA [Candidatus Competibacteraceae bacterium]
MSEPNLTATAELIALGVPETPRSLPNLNRAPFEIRALKSGFLTALTWIAALLASIPLLSVIYMLIIQGGSRLDWEALTALPPSAFEQGGGFGNAIVGTLVMVGLATLISVPIGIFAAIYLAILDPDSRLAHSVRFLSKALTGFPSILAGVFVYAVLVVTMKTYSALAGGVALAVLMLPTVVLAAEQAMMMVPKKMKDAAFGIGCTRAQVIWKVVLPTGAPGILTGVMLAIAGAAGNSAPLLFTALFSGYYLTSLTEPTASLAILIFNFSGMPYDNQIELAWAASLVLVMVVLVFNILARIIGRQKH